MGRRRFTSILVSKWVPEKEKELDEAVLDMATDIHREAVIMAPKATRALANSGRVERIGIGMYRVIFGGGSVPYALRRHYENRLHPGTLHYLEKPGDRISKQVSSYLRKV